MERKNPGKKDAMAKEAKTNAMRMLDRKKVSYEAFPYECDEFIDGCHSADLIGAPYEQSFKTLVMEGKSGAYYVFVVPIEKEVDRKAAARAVGEKAVDMIHVKDILKITGYVRGGCSPLGMKKQYPVIFDSSAEQFQEIYVSGGRIGLTLKVPMEKLLEVTNGKTADITV
jgi:Cys-tRNA(Pro)/Cys-tRNA(Cys) deacylase